MQFFLRHKKLHMVLIAELFLLALYLFFRQFRPLMNFLASHVTVPLRRGIGSICYLVDFSVAEALCVVLVIAGAVYFIWSVAAVCRARGRRAGRAYSAALGLLCAGLGIYVGFCFLLGIDSYADGFQEKSGIYARAVEESALRDVTAYFAEELSQAAGKVERDENGLFAVPREEILAGSTGVYDAVEQQFPFLAFDDPGVKPVYFSRVLSALDFTGIYCPFTGESNVNMDSPACLLGSTVAHELAHQRGITSEQECNFLAVLACTTCGDDVYAYAGWLMGYIHLGNALYTVDQEAYWAIRDTLPETVEADLAAQSAYWDQFRDKAIQKVSNQVYDRFLKSYGQTQGIRSYGTVVDLLVTYYQDKI